VDVEPQSSPVMQLASEVARRIKELDGWTDLASRA